MADALWLYAVWNHESNVYNMGLGAEGEGGIDVLLLVPF